VKEEAINESHILALVDAWPPAVMPPEKAGHGQHADLDHRIRAAVAGLSTLDWCKYLVETDYAADGYGHAAAKLWDAQGRVDRHEPADRDDLCLNQ
jgi:acyl-CoA thioesterase